MVHTLSEINDTSWEMMWSPYPESLYEDVLSHVQTEDIVLEIGAGDMRLPLLLAEKVRRVYALEIQHWLIEKAIPFRSLLQNNITILNQDARNAPFPDEITVAVLLMRHCTHFRLYADKLKDIGCRTLITNARWRMGLEVIDLQAQRQLFDQIPLGWYACWCGNTGFKPGPVEELTEEIFDTIYEVIHCPNCSNKKP